MYFHKKITSFDEVVIMLHKFDSNSEHTSFTRQVIFGFLLKIVSCDKRPILKEHLTYAVYIMIQCTDPATPAVKACCELPVSLQEAVLCLKTPSPITVLSEKGEGFFQQLLAEAFPHFRKEQIKRRPAQAIFRHTQTDASRGRQSALST